MAEKKEPYVSGEDRPEVSVDPDMLVSQLRVHDLIEILGRRTGKQIHPKFEGHSPLKEFFDKPFPEVASVLGLSAEPFAGTAAGASGPTPYPWSAHWNMLVQQTQALSGVVQRLEDQVARLSSRAG